MIEYSWIEDIAQFRAVAPKWDEAVIRSGNHNPFLLSDFVSTWWKHFYKNRQLRVLSIYNNNEILGGIPLCLERGSGRFGFARLLRHVGGAAANYAEPLYVTPEAKVLPYLCEALAKKNDWDVLCLTDVPAGSPLIEEARRSVSNGNFSLSITHSHMNWAIDLAGGIEDYLFTIPNKLRRHLRAKRKYAFQHYGEVKLRAIKGREEVEQYFDLFVRFSRDSFSARNRRSSFENPEQAAFFREFLALMEEKQKLDAHALIAGEKVLAISFGYRFGKGFNWVLTGFNYDYSDLNPGYLLIEELIWEITRRGETYYNWYGHGQFYKTQWCNKQSPLYRFVLVRPTWKGLCYQACQWAEKALRSNQVVVNLLRKAKRA